MTRRVLVALTTTAVVALASPAGAPAQVSASTVAGCDPGAKLRYICGFRNPEDLVQVPGSANSKLSDADLSALLNWLVPKMGGPAEGAFKPYTPAEVATYRARRMVDVVGTRAALIARFPAQTEKTGHIE